MSAVDPSTRVGVSPFHAAGSLQGFVISGRWPDSTKEWAQLLALAVRVGAMPGLLHTSTVFGVREELPDDPAPGTVGIVLAEGPVLGDEAVAPGAFADHQPPEVGIAAAAGAKYPGPDLQRFERDLVNLPATHAISPPLRPFVR